MTENAYDFAPYPLISHSDTHPDKAATIAMLMGLTPPPVTNCRVLEIGCASGGNLLPMAEQLPDSTFVGIDYAQKQIDIAKERAEQLGIENIRFETIDILDIDEDFGKFDYIISHGIYSWIPEDVRDQLIAVCKQNLTPNGIAYVSYNTYPGWHALMYVRDLMQWHTRDIESPEEKMGEAFQIMNFMTSTVLRTGHNPPIARYLEAYMNKRFKYDKDSNPMLETSLLHDEMEEVNQPVYFREFNSHIEEHGLQFLAEIPFVQAFMPDIPDDIKRTLGNISDDLIEMEQYIDFIRHRTFRRTLIMHNEIEFERRLKPERLQQFFIASRANIGNPAEEDDESITRFVDSDDVTFATNHPISNAAMTILIETRGIYAFDDLFNRAAIALDMDNPSEQDKALLAENLLKGYTSSTELVELYSYDLGMVLTPNEKPIARPLARLDAESRELPNTTNLKHERVTLDTFVRLILPLLDGDHDRDDILEKLVEHVAEGRIGVRTKDGEPVTKENAKEIFSSQLEAVLNWLGRSGLLIG